MESSIHKRTKQSQKQTEDRKKKKLIKKKDQSQNSWLWNKCRQMAFCLGQKKNMVQTMYSIRTGNLIHSQALPFKLLH